MYEKWIEKIQKMADMPDDFINNFPSIKNTLSERKMFAKNLLSETDKEKLRICAEGIRMTNHQIKEVLCII